MQFKLFGKTYLVIFAFGLSSLIALSLVVYIYGGRYQAHVESMNGEVVAYAEAETAHVFRDAARAKICDAASMTEESAEKRMSAKPEAYADIVYDPIFASTTAHTVFERGATGIAEPKERRILTHPRADLVGKRLPDLAEYSSPTFTALWDLFDASIGLDGVSGSYMKVDGDGSAHEHIVCFMRITTLTNDNVRLVAFATAYREDLGANGDMLSASLRQKYGAASAEMLSAMSDMRNFLIIALVLLLISTFLVAWLFSRSVARPLQLLAHVCEQIAFGKLDTPIPEFTNTDEVAELAESIRRMQKSLSAQTLVIAQQAKMAEERTNDLKEALRIAEERTKQILNLERKQ